MKTTISSIAFAVTLALGPLLSGQDTQTRAPLAYNPDRAGTNSGIIAAEYLPSVPYPWQITSVQPLLSSGNTVAYIQVFLFNPNTRQQAVWLIQQ